MKESKADVFGRLSSADKIKARKTSITAILATDGAHHFATVSELTVLVDVHAKSLKNKSAAPLFLDKKDEKKNQKLVGILLHAADISNPARTWAISKVHSRNCVDEFFRQGDKEKELNMPVSPGLFDRDTVNFPKTQIGFLEFVVAPLYCVMRDIFTELDPSPLQNLVENRSKWQEEYLKTLSPEDREK